MQFSTFKTEPVCYIKGINYRQLLKYINIMRKDKVRVYKLRREGKSYKEIRKLLGTTLSTIAGWLKDEEWSKQIRDELGAKESMSFPAKMAAIQKANKARWTKKYKEYKIAAESEFIQHQNDPLFVSGLMLF